jgi:hypothetical protein
LKTPVGINFGSKCEEDFIIEFETPLECLLKSEREHDRPRVIGVATTRKKAQNELVDQKGQTPEKTATYKGRSLTRNTQATSVP